MRCYKTPWGWFFQYNFQDDKVGFAVEKNNFILMAKITRIISKKKYEEISFEKLPLNIKTIITASQSCLIETAHKDLQRIPKNL